MRLVETDEFLVNFRAAAIEIDEHRDRYWRRVLNLRPPLWTVPAVAAVILALFLITSAPRNTNIQPGVLLLQSLRGPESQVQMTPWRPYVMTFDLPVESRREDYEVEIVDADGKTVFDASAQIKDNRPTVLANGLRPGVYWVRLYQRRPIKELTEEYGLQVE
jgi:hypothetical protein